MSSIFSRISAAGRALVAREERALPPPNVSIYREWGMPALFKPEESLKAYGDNVWLYRAVLSIAMEIARTKFKLKKADTPDGEIEYVTKHQALETLRRPQVTKAGKSMLTFMDMMLVLGMRMLLNGEEFWVLDKRMSGKFGGSPREIQPALPEFMHTALTASGEIDHYIYRLPEKHINLDPLDVVHFKLPDPRNIYRGHSPVQGIRYALDTHKEADQLNVKQLQNNAVPAGIVTTKSAVNDSTLEKMRSQWRQMYAGSGNAGKVAFVPEGMDFKTIQRTNAEMQFTEGKSVNRDEILANYGVGLEIMGRTESQTRANAEAAIFVFQRFGVLPYLEKIVDTLNNDYLPAFAGTDGLEFCFDDPVPQNTEEKRLNAEALWRIGGLTSNEARKMFGFERIDLPGMDVPYLPMSAMPVGSEDVLPPDEGPLPGEEEPGEDVGDGAADEVEKDEEQNKDPPKG